jgi:hypothetical protein
VSSLSFCVPHCVYSESPLALLQDMSRRNATEIVKAMVFFGYKFNLEPGRTPVDPSDLSNRISDDEVSAMGRK